MLFGRVGTCGDVIWVNGGWMRMCGDVTWVIRVEWNWVKVLFG